jgi:hypothetical protein
MATGGTTLRRPLLCGLGAALVITMGGVGPARADNGPHTLTATGAGAGFNQLAGAHSCATCHRARTAQSALPGRGPDALCLLCHGRSALGASTDVIDGVGYDGGRTQDDSAVPGALRGGGFDYAQIASGKATRATHLRGTTLLAGNQVIPVLATAQPATSAHTVAGASGAAADAAGAVVTLECGSCHDPHGNGNYRILALVPDDSGAWTAGAGVRIPDAGAKVYTTTNYWVGVDGAVPPVVGGLTVGTAVPPVIGGVTVGTAVPEARIANISQWCVTCHTGHRFDANNNMGGTNCLTCHVAHGSNATITAATSSQVRPADVLAASGPSSSLLRVDDHGICFMCHTL